MKNNNALIAELASTITAVRTKKIEPKVAREISSLSRTIMSACRTQVDYNTLILKTPRVQRVQFLEN
jgi:hypothetical protein